jgi:predicted nucleic acid-binding protein
MYLVDTNILSISAPTKVQPHLEVLAWLQRNSELLFLSVVTLLELSYGVSWLNHRRATEKATRLPAWIDRVCFYYRPRILPVDVRVALRAGALISLARGRGSKLATEDAVIAATADLHSLIVLTANARHFAPTGVALINPFERLPPETD